LSNRKTSDSIIDVVTLWREIQFELEIRSFVKRNSAETVVVGTLLKEILFCLRKPFKEPFLILVVSVSFATFNKKDIKLLKSVHKENVR